MHHDVGAVLERSDEIWRGDGVVDDQRDTVGVRDTGDALEVEDVQLRVGDRLRVERLGVRLHRRPPGLQVVRVLDEAHRDAELRQCVVQQVVGTAVEPRRGDDVVTGVGHGEQRDRLGGLPGGHQQRADAALECGDLLLDGVMGGVVDAGVDVAQLLEGEQLRTVLGGVEGERGRLVDRQRTGVGGGVGRLAGVDLQRSRISSRCSCSLLVSRRWSRRGGRSGRRGRRRSAADRGGKGVRPGRTDRARRRRRDGGRSASDQRQQHIRSHTAALRSGVRLVHLLVDRACVPHLAGHRVNHPGHPTACGGLPPSEPGLDAGTHDLTRSVSDRPRGRRPRSAHRRVPDWRRRCPGGGTDAATAPPGVRPATRSWTAGRRRCRAFRAPGHRPG